MLQEAGLCVLNTTRQGQRGVEGAQEAESPGETAGLQQLDPGSSLGVVGSPQTAGMFELLPRKLPWSLGRGLKAAAPYIGLGGGHQGSALLQAGLAQGCPDAWVLLPFWCRRSQERVSVHPHRLHPSFDFGHQLQTPQPRYLAEGTDW